MFFYLAFIASGALGGLIAITQLIPALTNPLRAGEIQETLKGALRGIARLVIVAGSASFVSESFKLSQAYTDSLLERGMWVIPLVTDGLTPEFEMKEDDEMTLQERKKLWQLRSADTPEWSKWLDEQKDLANVSRDSPVYLSLRMDGRVRGSGVGYPPWSAFVAQLPPVKGIWSGLFDGMDGRV